MSQSIAVPKIRPNSTGWLGVAALALGYTGLVLANFWLPLSHSNLTFRLWDWTQLALTLVALVLLILQRQLLKAGTVALGFGLAALNTLSYSLNNPSPAWMLQEGIAIWACFSAGVVLLKQVEAGKIPAFQPPLGRMGKSIAFGLLVAVPLAVINNLYFYANQGGFILQNVFYSAFEALRPAIHEEIVFRFFVLALCFYLLRSSASPRLATLAALTLAVVPHSFNHLPDLFLENPLMGLAMLFATSLLFGLPMAVLQIKKNLEAGIAFHWLIDFARFLFGF
jgi:hypothetical protein